MAKKLLIVDDEPGISRIMQRFAERRGWDVVSLLGSSEVVDTFLAFRPDVVVLDMVMPEKDGIDVLHELLLSGVPTRVILTSGFGTAMLRMALGVASYHGVGQISLLPKPFRREEFEGVLLAAEEPGPVPV